MDYEAIRANDGTKPRPITAEWFHYCLEVLPPANWHPGRAVYGSDAYLDYGQDDDVALEALENDY